jgi:hypothetical protein
VFEGTSAAVPYLDRAVGGGGGDIVAIGRELDACDCLLMAVEEEGRRIVQGRGFRWW